MKKLLVLILSTLFLGALTVDYPEVISVADYAKYEYLNGPEMGDDYYIGNIFLDNNAKKIWFEPVKTRENVGDWATKRIWQKFTSQSPRLYIDKESFYLNRKIKEIVLNGIKTQDAEGKIIVIKIGNEAFPSAFKSYVSKTWGIVNQSIGEKYFRNGWSKTKGDELAQNREYYNFEYPFQKMTQKEYIAHSIKVIGMIK